MAIKRKICPTDLDVFDTNENKIQCMSGKTIWPTIETERETRQANLKKHTPDRLTVQLLKDSTRKQYPTAELLNSRKGNVIKLDR